MIFSYAVIGAYFSILLLLMVYCMHRYVILNLYFRTRNRVSIQPGGTRMPIVTVQLPVYNEMYVVERLIRAAAALDYPPDRLEIQVLDDSTDETSSLAQGVVEQMRIDGCSIVYLHRDSREGYKAGALARGLECARGELIAVFDADFVPSPDFLRRIVPYFEDVAVGMVQSRWGHINRAHNLLTRLEAILLDAHFIIEHTARNRSGLFFNFNGTAGVWRAGCIRDAGGWQHDTLTEDLDLSYRAQMNGWKFIFLPDLVTPAEIPADMNSFKCQQHRWAKGGIETARKILPQLLRSRQPLAVKSEACFHLLGNINYPLLVLLALLSYPALVVRINMGWRHLFILDLFCFLASILPIALYFGTAARQAGMSLSKTIAAVPLVMALGIGLCINNGRGALEALFRQRSEFARTPKFRIETPGDTWRRKRYTGRSAAVQTRIELGLSLYFLLAIMFALRCRVWASLPFLGLFFFGFLYVGGFSLYQTYVAGAGQQPCERPVA